MRILMLCKACIVGIYQRKLELIAGHDDVELTVLVPPAWRDERGITPLECAYTDGYTLKTTPIRFNGNFHLHYYPQFARELAIFSPDIVHLDEEPYNLATFMALRAAQRLTTAKTLFFSWQNINRSYPFPFRWIEQWVLKHSDFGLMGTQSAADIWRAKGFEGPLAVVPQFGVDPELFHPPAQRSHGNPVVIGYAGRLVKEKGIDLILQALCGLTDYDWRFEIIGGGPHESELRKQVAESGLEDRVYFTGLVPSIEMPDRFRQLDVLVIPSRTRPNWKEQYGRVIIEAMASGACVIGSDSGAIPDVIGDAGLVFPEDNVVALREKLHTLLSDPQMRQQLADAGRQRVLDQFTQEQVAAQTVAVYRQLLGTGLEQVQI